MIEESGMFHELKITLFPYTRVMDPFALFASAPPPDLVSAADASNDDKTHSSLASVFRR